ncbi:imidazole glycerol phosphate synthase subunit HisH [Clostridium saccharobutylicum]|uniref:Imidazole glycerol phosphate synthase subunit HisH n=2 Tax=Clostridium saccharobutylicum TaxID=169679 RepID=U5MWG1_CLOSA|nr:imidazole glycerol phosphate synthase subunit HisH [Clostridium saccharobutylicum]AGX44915.1 imidazole glycerol phosphate synthase subunit HisH 1 [Clostridium saccharobutylicum DSM 13864]MBA8788106.1 glutamine amidotransferase [Clostridium saccharobutylicum]MBA8894783.1 glutamine amidotransferase [Clostridium saccharobutylicum]MBA8992500.1 glutamine amidotransferase [Clostridium saccharobutylicum]MBA8997119.1 glutamine amidotransferase [Clostridium saccharobutylicum]
MQENKICIIDYGMGNLMSVFRAFEMLGEKPIISNKKEEILNSNKIILPGVGAFSVAMNNLCDLDLIDTLSEKVIKQKTPFLGICLGMQLIAEESYEFGHHKGLGWIPATVRPFEISEDLRIPHMGWNDIEPISKNSSLFQGLSGDLSYYFVHSYHVECNDSKYIGSTCEYGEKFVSSIQYENIYATQFHPEKSQKNGIQLLRNFISV